MNPIQYSGPISSSKSLYNRALIVQSFYPHLKIQGNSKCEDVLLLQQALQRWEKGDVESFDCGHGGTTFRFLLARLSREAGHFAIKGSERLFSRPHDELFQSLHDLEIEVEFLDSRNLEMNSRGWSLNGPLKLNTQTSSQYLSALLLSAWELDEDLEIQMDEEIQMGSYLDMTCQFLNRLGMEIIKKDQVLVVPKNQKCHQSKVIIEPDMSSIFAVTAFAAISGQIEISHFPKASLQPDSIFLEIFKEIGVPFEWQDSVLKVRTTDKIKPLHWNLKNSPDLFPVLSVLLSCFDQHSQLSGLDSLAHKESHRLEKTQALLTELGIETQFERGTFHIFGKSHWAELKVFDFDPDQDHRMAMAAALANHKGSKINILNPHVVNKSFPEFWEIISP